MRYHFLTKPEIRLLLIAINIFTIAAAILLYFKKVSPYTFIIFSSIWMLVMLFVWQLMPNSIYKSSETFRDHFNMEIEESGIQLETSRGTQHWEWNRFLKYMETPFFFHLYFSANSFFLVPKDVMVHAEDQQMLRELLRRHVTKKTFS